MAPRSLAYLGVGWNLRYDFRLEQEDAQKRTNSLRPISSPMIHVLDGRGRILQHDGKKHLLLSDLPTAWPAGQEEQKTPLAALLVFSYLQKPFSPV